MRILVATLLAAGVCAAAGRAQDDPKATIEKAIKAHGGAANLDKFLGSKSKVKGSMLAMGMEIDFEGTITMMQPDKAKAVLTLSVNGNKLPYVQTLNGDKAAVAVNDQKLPIEEGQIEEMRAASYAGSLLQLTPLLKADFTLKSADGGKLDGKELAAVVVSRAKQKDIKLFFDKDSGLLIKLERQAKDDGGKEIKEEQVFSEYKEISGLKLPHKEIVFKDGKKNQEVVTESIKVLEKIDDKEFMLDN